MNISKNEILKAYNFRHACKEYNGNIIPEEDFKFILETGRLSPSSFGFEPWQFIVVQNKELREQIADISWGIRRSLPTASHMVIILAAKKPLTKYDSEYITKIMNEVQKLPTEVAEGKRSAFENFEKSDFNLFESDRSLYDWASKQTYIALANMLTASASIGIDSCPIEGFDIEKLETMLEKEGILDREKYGVSVMATFGYRKDDPREKTRRSIEEVTSWIL